METTTAGEASGEGRIAADLVQRIAAGDTDAERLLFERYHRGLLFLLQRLTGSPEQAEDLRQETFRIVLERLRGRSLEQPEGLLGFLRGTARNLVLAERRKANRRPLESGSEELAEMADPAPSAAESLVRAEDARLFRRLLGELRSERDRQLLLRFYVAGEEKQEICRTLGLSHPHFKRVLYRARQRFKELVAAFEQRQGAAP